MTQRMSCVIERSPTWADVLKRGIPASQKSALILPNPVLRLLHRRKRIDNGPTEGFWGVLKRELLKIMKKTISIDVMLTVQ